MLVLNTNNQNQNKLSNDILNWEYYDFSWSVMLYPSWLLQPSGGWYDDIDIAWTKCYYTQKLSSEWLLSWWINGANIWITGFVLAKWSAFSLYRLTTVWTLEWWEIVGKNILRDMRWYNAESTIIYLTGKVTVGLLHTNWSITTIADIVNWDLLVFHNIKKRIWFIKKETDWLIAQPWDRVVVTFNIKIKNNNSDTLRAWFNFWYSGSNKLEDQPHPIQVSID